MEFQTQLHQSHRLLPYGRNDKQGGLNNSNNVRNDRKNSNKIDKKFIP